MHQRISSLLPKALALAAIALAAIMLTRCAPVQPQEVAQVKVVAPPFERVDVGSRELKFNAEQGASFRLPNGTVIDIPPGILVDATGAAVKGEVDLHYREFHNATDIIAAGITMDYKENGMNEVLQTAGMMELRASQHGQEVFIQQGKEIAMQLASFAPQADMKLFYLDQQEGWQLEGQPTEQPATKEATQQPEARPRRKMKAPAKPEKLRDGAFVFGFAPDYAQFPELNAYKGVEWQYAGADSATDPQKNKRIFKKVWSDARLQALDGERYTLLLTTPKDTFRSVVKPAFRGKNYDKAMAEFSKRQAEYEASLTQRVEQEQNVMNQASALYSFGVQRFGVWNCDVFYNMPDVVTPAETELKLKGIDAEVVNVYHVTGNNRTVLQYPEGKMANFRFSSSQDNFLLAVLKGNRAAVMRTSDFRKMNVGKLRQGGKCELELEASPQPVRNFEELEKLLASR